MTHSRWPTPRFTTWRLAAAVTVLCLGPGACDERGRTGVGEPSAEAAGPARSDPDERSTLEAMAAVEHYLASSDLASAEIVAERLADRAAGDVRALELHGRVLLARAIEDDDDDRLGRAYARYAAAATQDPRLHQNAGSIAAMLGRPEAALEHYAAAVRHEPLNPQPPLYAAQVQLELGRLDEAERSLERALAIDPDEPLVHASLAVLALERERPDEARRRIARARELDPEDLGLRLQAARIHRRAGMPRRAAELLVGLDESTLVQAAVTAELAAAYSALGEHRRAAEAWLRRYHATSSEPEGWRSAVAAAGCLLDAGDRVEARRWLELVRPLAGEAEAVRLLETRLTEGE